MTSLDAKPLPRRAPRSLRGRFAVWSLLSTMASLLVFALTAFVVLVISELSEPSTLTPAEINWEVGRDVLVAMAIATPFGLLIATGGSLWLSQKILAPISDIIHAARDMTAHDLERRLPVPASDDELSRLVLAQNALFERLEQGFAALSQFAANASHEIRTPLAVIGSELEIALRRPRSREEWEGAARRSLDEVRRLTRLVEALLDLARADTTSPVPQSRASVRSVLSALVAQFLPEAQSRRIVLEPLEENGEDIWVQASDEALSIALSNLLSNAIRYTPEGGRVMLTLEERDEARTAIHVDDSGPGVAPHVGEEIFAPFARGAEGRRADQRDADGHRGLGLGLAITKRIVERHHGALSFGRSSVGGARFSIELPTASVEP